MSAAEMEFEPKIVAFCCNWCSYAGADLAGTSRFQYPPNVRIIRVMCSGRVDPSFVIEAFKKGADGVIVAGCHINDCHYISANHWTKRRAEKLWTRMKKLGIRPERLQLEWISAAEGPRFAQIMRNLEKMRQEVTADEIQHTRKVLAEQRRKGKSSAEQDETPQHETVIPADSSAA